MAKNAESINSNNQENKEKLETIKNVVQKEAIDTKLILDSIPIGVCITDQQGVLINVNIAFSKLFGYTKEELIGQPFTILLPERNRQSFSYLHKKWKGQLYEQRGNWRMINKDGDEFTVLSNASFQQDEQTGQYQQFTFLVDTKDQEQSHLELQSTIDLLYQRLEIQDHAHQQDEHDLKNNVGSMVNIADILLNRKPTQEQERWLRMLMQVGTKTMHMLKASSDYARMEKESYAPEISKFSFAETMQEVISNLQEIANRKSASFSFAYNGKATSLEHIAITLEADRYYMEELLRFLLQNALEASPDHAEITIEVEKEEAFVLKFHNQGIIPSDIQSHFFEKYVSSGKNQGSGLGTYLAKLIVELHGGTITYRTSEKAGTTIFIHLPRQVVVD
uniref:histidine kinase n=1 Tax=Roseihalotalea indica TaxID=2867963 RepID=A0AA49JDP3_9BACT|nr:PAS domain-containing sensor histidine kinase [Tunicatimonas sp. TK19036]